MRRPHHACCITPHRNEQKSSPPNPPHQDVISNTHNQNHLSQGKKLLHKRSCHVTSSLPALYFRRPHRNPDRQYFFGVVSAYLCRTTRGCEQFTVHSLQFTTRSTGMCVLEKKHPPHLSFVQEGSALPRTLVVVVSLSPY